MSLLKRLFGKSDKSNAKPVKRNDNQRGIDIRDLHRNIEKGFNISEIKTLCFDLHIDYENLEGATKSAKVLSLVRYCQKRKQIDELIALCERQRPHIFTVDSPGNSSQSPPRQVSRATATPSQRKHSRAQAELEMNFDQYRAFARDRFTLDEFLDFLLTDDYFQQFAFNVPANVTHNYATREVWFYAQRRRSIPILLEKLKAVDPELFEKYANAEEV